VPMVVVPTTWDKPDNARRVTYAGAGVRVPARRCTPERLRAAVRQVLDQPRYRAGAQRLAGLLAAAPGPPAAAHLLEELSAAGRSVAAAGADRGVA
jgi:UDP:flavonoid glycosyltransferase YjiC (YdhE family)